MKTIVPEERDIPITSCFQSHCPWAHSHFSPSVQVRWLLLSALFLQTVRIKPQQLHTSAFSTTRKTPETVQISRNMEVRVVLRRGWAAIHSILHKFQCLLLKVQSPQPVVWENWECFYYCSHQQPRFGYLQYTGCSFLSCNWGNEVWGTIRNSKNMPLVFLG